MTRPHSVLHRHEPVEHPRTAGEALLGRASGCLACQELDAYLTPSLQADPVVQR